MALAAMLYLNVGQVGELYMNINEAKSEAAERINDRDLATLTISDAEFASGTALYLNDNELRYNGNLYDVSTSVRHGDKVTLKVLHDEKEEGLVANLKETIEHWGDNVGNNSKHPNTKHIVVTKDFMPSARYTFNASSSLIQIFSVNYSHASSSPLLAVLKSPPKLG